MRTKIARALRKWADLVDPRTSPSGPEIRMTVRLDCDTSAFEREVARVNRELELLASRSGGLRRGL